MAKAPPAGPQQSSGSDRVPQPPFPLDRPTSASWREQALSKVGELRFVRDWLLEQLPAERLKNAAELKITDTTEDHFRAASDAAMGGTLLKPRNFIATVSGSGVERVNSQLDAVEGELLRIAPLDYLRGEIFSLLAHIQLHLQPQDPRRLRVEAIAQRAVLDEEHLRTNGKHGNGNGTGTGADPTTLSESDRQAVISAVSAASSESRWKVSRLRSFRNVIVVSALLLSLAAIGMVVFAFKRPSALPVCFTPANVVCATSTTTVPKTDQATAGGEQTPDAQAATDAIMRKAASGWDVAVVELVGLVAAAIAAAAAIRKVEGTSTPYSLPVALAVLKLPTGALTALLGLLLMRGGFVPGLSALDSSAQIIAWALVFGYAQQLLTRFVDTQAESVLERSGGNEKSLAAPTGLAQAGVAAPV
jgi:hypothetical protein